MASIKDKLNVERTLSAWTLHICELQQSSEAAVTHRMTKAESRDAAATLLTQAVWLLILQPVNMGTKMKSKRFRNTHTRCSRRQCVSA